MEGVQLLYCKVAEDPWQTEVPSIRSDTMWKAACLILAASLIFPLLASWASPPEEEPATAWDSPAPTLPGDTGEPAAQVASQQIARLSLAKAAPEEGALPAERVQRLRNLQARNLEWRRFEAPAPARGSVCLAGGGGGPLCEVGAAVARMKPCLAADARDCPAVDAWREAMGEMGIRPAPQGMTRAVDRTVTRTERPVPK